MKPKILWLYSDWQANSYRANNNLYGAISYYRVIKPAQALQKYYDIDTVGADIQHWGTTDETYSRLKNYDLVISKHSRSPQDASNTLAACKHFGIKCLVDIDDNFLAIRPDNPAHNEYEYGNGPREYLSAFIGLADGVIVSTNPLKKAYKTLNKNIHVLPNCNDINDWPKEIKRKDDGKIRIGFAGGRGHLADLNLVLEPMSYILAKHPNVLFDVIGSITPQEAMKMGVAMNEHCKRNITQQFRIAGGTLAWKEYPDLLASFGWDIVIAPLVDDDFNRCKSHIRWLESSMVHAPVIASPVYPYYSDIQTVKTIQDGKTGLLAHNPQDWYDHLDDLITNSKQRHHIATNAYDYIKDHWQYDQWAKKWKQVIDNYI